MEIKTDIFRDIAMPSIVYTSIKKFEEDFGELIQYDKTPVTIPNADNKKKYFNEFIKIASKDHGIIYTYSKTYKIYPVYNEASPTQFSYINPHTINLAKSLGQYNYNDYTNENDKIKKIINDFKITGELEESNVNTAIGYFPNPMNTTTWSTVSPTYKITATYNFDISFVKDETKG